MYKMLRFNSFYCNSLSNILSIVFEVDHFLLLSRFALKDLSEILFIIY